MRHLYQPIQPVPDRAISGVNYMELLPAIGIHEYIHCYWHLHTSKELERPFDYRVVADGCIDVFFSLDNASQSSVMGLSNTFTTFGLEKDFSYAGIRFLPGMFPLLFNIKASELSNMAIDLALVLPDMSKFINNYFNVNTTPNEIKSHFDAYFIKLLSNTSFQKDARLYNAVNLIIATSGIVHFEAGLNTGMSPRQLRRIFDFYLGSTPKTFSKIVRFQNVLKSVENYDQFHAEKHFTDFGYYDQAHFIKEFKSFYGLTPGKILKA